MRLYKLLFVIVLLGVLGVSGFSAVLSVEPGSEYNTVEFSINVEDRESVDTIYGSVEEKPDWVTRIFPDLSYISSLSTPPLTCGFDDEDVKTSFGRYSEDLGDLLKFDFDISQDAVPGDSGKLVFKIFDNTGRSARIEVDLVVSGDARCNDPDLISVSTDSIISFPNPVRSVKGRGEVTIVNVREGSIIKIYNIRGDLIRELRVNKGLNYAKWYMKNNAGRLVSSGIYIYTVESPDGSVFRDKIVILK